MKFNDYQKQRIINALRERAARMDRGARQSKNDNLMSMFRAEEQEDRHLANLIEVVDYIEIGVE